MIHFKLGKKNLQVPSSWEDITFAQYLSILQGPKNTAELLSVFTGIPSETLKKANIFGLDEVLMAIKFAYKPMETPGKTTNVGPFTWPDKEIQFETLAQFEDMRSIMAKAPKDTPGFVAQYPMYCAIYLQKIKDGEYSFDKAKEMANEIELYPAVEVISLASFFLVKLLSLTIGISPNSHPANQNQKKSKSDMKTLRKRSVPTGRSRKRR